MRYIYPIIASALLLFGIKTQAQDVIIDSTSIAWQKAFYNEQLLVHADSGNIETVAFLLKNGADPNYQTWDGITPLMYATQTGKQQLVTLLLLKGANPNAKPVDGNTALHTATFLNLDTIAEILIKYGAEVDAPNINNVTPLHYSITNGYTYLTQLLIYYGANPNNTDLMGNSTVMMATYVGAFNTLTFLLDEGVDPNLPDNKGNTPLMVAAQFNDTLTMRKLLEYGADPLERNYSGYNALSIAIFYGAADAAQLLVNLNADSVSNSKKDNYLQLAKESELNEVYNLLKSKGHKESIKPRISQITPSAGVIFGNNEFMFDGGIGLYEALTKTSIIVGYAARPAARTIEQYINNRLYQMKEKRNMLYLGVEKNFGNIPVRYNQSLSLQLGIKGAYTQGNLKGTSINESSKFLIIPSFGILYKMGAVNASFTGEIIKLEQTSSNPLRISIKFAVPIQIGRYRIRPKQIEWLQ